MIKVIVADDHNLVREGIRALLEKAEDIQVVGEAENGQEAIDLVQSLKPNVLVMDIAMPGVNGIQALEQLRELELPTQVVILSMYADEIFVRQALQNGAKGYLLKGSFKEELLLTIRAASRGATYLSPTVSDSVLTPPASSTPSPASQLTPREHETAPAHQQRPYQCRNCRSHEHKCQNGGTSSYQFDDQAGCSQYC